MLFSEVIAVYCEKYMKHIKIHFLGKMKGFFMLCQVLCLVTIGL